MPMNSPDFKKLDILLKEETGKGRDVPGAVVLVRFRDEVVLHEAYGDRQTVPETLPTKRATVFDLASLSKPLSTGLLTMQMCRKGHLSLDATLPYWFGTLSEPAKGQISIRHLLSNSSGLSAWKPFYQDCQVQECPVSRDEFARRILADPLEALPGEKEIYSDLGFMLLGMILEKVAGVPLDLLFQDEIARPLGLGLTGYHRIPVRLERGQAYEPGIAATEHCLWRGRVLVGEVHDENCFALGGVAGHAGLFSTAGELDQIVAEILSGLQGLSSIFSQESLRDFLNGPQEPSRGTWALGWDTPSERGSTSGRCFSRNSVGHTGFTGTSLWIDLDKEIAVILLTNRVHPKRDNEAIRALRPRAHDLIMEEMLACL